MKSEHPSPDLDRLFKAPTSPAPSHASVHWELVGGQGRYGSWTPVHRQDRVRALAQFRGYLYAGIGPAQAEVWRLAHGVWQQVGGKSIFRSWPARNSETRGGVGLRPGHVWVNALLVDEQDHYLYAGVKDGQRGAQLWRFDGQMWEQIGGLGNAGDWISTDYDHVYALAWHEGYLYAGLQGHLTAFQLAENDKAGVDPAAAEAGGYHPGLGNGEIYRFDGEEWTCVAGRGSFGSWNEEHSAMWVYTLCSIGGDLYAAIGRHAVRNLRWIGEVWRFRSGRWEQIGGEGVRNSWQLNHTNLVTSLIDYQGKLVVGYNCQDIPNDPERFGNVWAWDPGDEQWHHLGFPASCPDTAIISAQSSFNASAVWDEHLVVVGGSADPTGCATVWALSIVENKWVCLGYPSMPRPANNADVWSQDAYGYSMMIFEDDLLVGCKGAEGTAHLWRCHRKQVS